MLVDPPERRKNIKKSPLKGERKQLEVEEEPHMVENIVVGQKIYLLKLLKLPLTKIYILHEYIYKS